jgi:ABC-type lipoprotein release transport system permease subunit
VTLLLGVLGLYDDVAFIVSGCTVAASWVPPRRAARLDPMKALRAE